MATTLHLTSVVNHDGRVDLIAVGGRSQADDPTEPAVWWLPQRTLGEHGWSGDWRSLGAPGPGLLGNGRDVRISAACNVDGRLEAAVLGADHVPYHAWQAGYRAGTWHAGCFPTRHGG